MQGRRKARSPGSWTASTHPSLGLDRGETRHRHPDQGSGSAPSAVSRMDASSLRGSPRRHSVQPRGLLPWHDGLQPHTRAPCRVGSS